MYGETLLILQAGWNLAAKPGKINLSGVTYNLVKEHFDCLYRGRLEAKGKGEIDMYFVQNIKTPIEEFSFEAGNVI